MIPAQELVERGMAAADALGADGCMVLVEESSHVDVRYALNTTTTAIRKPLNSSPPVPVYSKRSS